MTNIQKMLGKPSKSGMMRDSDGDGVRDMIDCKPFDKNKQGFFHKVKGKFTGRSEQQQMDHDAGERAAKGIRREKATAERRKQQELTAIDREKVRGEVQRKRQRASLSGPSFGERLSKSIVSTSDGKRNNSPKRIKRITRKLKPLKRRTSKRRTTRRAAVPKRTFANVVDLNKARIL